MSARDRGRVKSSSRGICPGTGVLLARGHDHEAVQPAGIGIVGCGAISDVYFEAGSVFQAFDVVACADQDRDRAREKARAFDVPAAGGTAELLDNPDVDVVVNLTPPAAHAEVTAEALQADCHVYTEKPIAASAEEARAILDVAESSGCQIGSAPDTVLGQAVQTARRAIDDGRIGDPIGGTAFMVSGGHEGWHPDPDLYYRRGGGPLFDMGPYYLTALVHLLGPISRVAGSTSQAFAERTIDSGDRAGETIPVDVPTHETGVIEFASGALVTALFTFDVPRSTIAPQQSFEIHGTRGTILGDDPDGFAGTVQINDSDSWEEVDPVPAHPHQQRGLGIVDLVSNIRDGTPHRTSGRVATHVLEAMEGLRASGSDGQFHAPNTSIERPVPFSGTF